MLVCVVLGVVIGSVFYAMAPRHATCDHKVMREFPSPNGNYVGLVIRTNCGATTQFASSVGIRNKEEEFDADRDFFFSVKGENNIELVWRDSPFLDVTHREPLLTIIYDKGAAIYRQAIVWRAERIAYRER